MFIQTQDTPNPNTLKFIPGIDVIKHGSSRQFNKNDDCKESSLAKQLFEINGIESVFFGNDFISITKNENINWDEIKTFILSNLVD